MNKSNFLSALALLFTGAVVADDNMVGNWDCKMVSDYGEFEFELTLNEDSTYTKTTKMFGNLSIESGDWLVEDNELVMNRKKFNKNGEEKDSDIQFRRGITSVSGTTLKLKHDEVVTSCART